jgi:glycosyltransferase involved in cell wall biosynthesis
MKILLISNIGVDLAGTEVIVRQLKEGLITQGHDARLLAGDTPDSPQRFSDYTFRSFSEDSLARYFLLLCNPFAVWSLYKVLKTFRPDVVHLHVISNASPFILFLLKRIPTVLTIHYDMVFDPTRPEDLPNLKIHDKEGPNYFVTDKKQLRYYAEKVRFFFLRRFYRNIDVVMACSHFYAEAARDSKLFKKVTVIHNGIKLLPFTPIKNYYNLLYLGRIVKSKGVGTLLQAMPDILRQFPEITLTIVGDGPYKSDCEMLAKTLGIDNQVQFLGYKDYGYITHSLIQSTILVVPSIWPEAFGLVSVEAMSVGRPVVASRVGGIPEIVLDGKTGLLVSPSDPKELAGALVTLLRDPSRCIEFGHAGRIYAEEQFSTERYIEKTVAAYKSLLRS